MTEHPGQLFAAGPRLRPEEVPALTAVALRDAGINLHGGKIEFLQARLSRRVTAHGLESFTDYARLLERDAAERREFVEALTTHTTSFFREGAQYRWLEITGLAALEQARQHHRGDLVIWSAACSTGPEGWSALMVTERARRMQTMQRRFRLIGTDISRRVLKTAADAVYPAAEVAGVPVEMRRLFLLSSRSGDARCRIVPELRTLAQWRQANLVEGTGLDGIEADIAFLRNVLIYFDAPTQAAVIDRVVRRLRPGGYLFTGHTETAFRHPELTPLGPSIYRKDER
ncbi:CheR family methyltransferase [Roseitranquillus sediminis]|uniref:CheR family methyltransferase n=1 Tax=Roseitranquillus sediminis TaxID=2809051 RepID=UPI001D0C4C72|nr:protein-glutamate O-methyltransferase CheR [Roseitranquillus sediminis]MBM9593602.1 protein-glutamate O-methyltransferase CheR [Roseitranquillus sediminis]